MDETKLPVHYEVGMVDQAPRVVMSKVEVRE